MLTRDTIEKQRRKIQANMLKSVVNIIMSTEIDSLSK